MVPRNGSAPLANTPGNAPLEPVARTVLVLLGANAFSPPSPGLTCRSRAVIIIGTIFALDTAGATG
ncbi:MAG: hypothetical protein M3301_10100 [Chloroflexota bacterium]|nr:hypothetical protein [Chloroflexota bacterium]